MKRKTTEQFIADAVAVHGDRYDYSKVEYINAHTKVKIVCKDHGEFEQTPDKHSNGGRGCPQCGIIRTANHKIVKASIKRDWNFEQPEGYKLIPLPCGRRVKVDNEDFDRVKDINWYYHEGYAKNNTYGCMHRYIVNAPENMLVDHRYHDTLDNRKSKLRVCTH